MWLWFLAAWACTVEYEARVVGTHPTDDLVVVRIEAKELVHPKIDLVLFDAAAKAEKKRFSILALDDEGDAAVRGRNWKAAEAELAGLGVVFDPEAKPVPDPTAKVWPETVEIDGTTLRFGSGFEEPEGSDPLRTLTVEVSRAGRTLETRTLAGWAGRDANSYHYVHSVWALPEDRVAVIEANGCAEPDVHFLGLR